MPDQTTTIGRSELYEAVWKEPVRTLARRYGLSDVGLRKICLRLHVPLPERGHWARIRLGREGQRRSLPPLPDGAPSEIVARVRRFAQVGAVNVGPAIAVPGELRNPHKLVSEASRLLRSREPADGLVRCWGTSCLDIAVGRGTLGRALRIMNALIRTLEERGLRVEVTRWLSYEQETRRGQDEVPGNATRVLVSGEWIQFGLIEKRSVALPPPREPPKRLKGAELESWMRWNQPRKELVPNGVLELAVKDGPYGLRKTWHDGKRRPLEDCLNEFVAHLPSIAEGIRAQREAMLGIQRERVENERRRREEEQRRREEEERIRRFEEMLGRWRLARDAREYVAAVREIIAAANASIPAGNSLEESLKWAEAYAKCVDPLTRIREEVASLATASQDSE